MARSTLLLISVLVVVSLVFVESAKKQPSKAKIASKTVEKLKDYMKTQKDQKQQTKPRKTAPVEPQTAQTKSSCPSTIPSCQNAIRDGAQRQSGKQERKPKECVARQAAQTREEDFSEEQTSVSSPSRSSPKQRFDCTDCCANCRCNNNLQLPVININTYAGHPNTPVVTPAATDLANEKQADESEPSGEIENDEQEVEENVTEESDEPEEIDLNAENLGFKEDADSCYKEI